KQLPPPHLRFHPKEPNSGEILGTSWGRIKLPFANLAVTVKPALSCFKCTSLAANQNNSPLCFWMSALPVGMANGPSRSEAFSKDAQVWERPWSLEEIRQHSASWSLAADSGVSSSTGPQATAARWRFARTNTTFPTMQR
ncbi:hypothetical protein GOODEAATRI_027707, partial [Goodea atripinnis]